MGQLKLHQGVQTNLSRVATTSVPARDTETMPRLRRLQPLQSLPPTPAADGSVYAVWSLVRTC